MGHSSPIKTIHSHCHHLGWDNRIDPVDRIEPGTAIELQCLDAGNGHFRPDSTADAVDKLPSGKTNPVTGPVWVEGAEPGDILAITLDSFRPSGFGWTAIIPGFGLLADQFPAAALHLWSYDQHAREPVAFGSFARIPLRPFAGTLGVAPAEPGTHSVIPPRRIGGNLDTRDLCAGSTLYLPVEVTGALFSMGDTHAAQGDGEVCGTAIESAMDVTVKLDLIKQTPLAMPRFSTSGPVTRHLDASGYEAFTGVGPDLMHAARDAVSGAIDWMCREQRMPAEQAYMLCSVCGDLRISEIVDLPNVVVSFYLPRLVFE